MGCLYLARQCCRLREPWSLDLAEYTGYSGAQLQAGVVADMLHNTEVRTIYDYAIAKFERRRQREPAVDIYAKAKVQKPSQAVDALTLHKMEPLE